MLCNTYSYHFKKSAFMLALKICMRLYLVVKNNAICFCRIFVAVDRCVSSVIHNANLNNFHTGKNWHSHCLFCNAVTVDDFKVSLNAAAAVASHSRNNERLCAPFFKLVAHCSYHCGIFRDTSAAYCNSNSLALESCFVNVEVIKLIFKMTFNIVNLVCFKKLFYSYHFWHWNVINALYREFNFREINKCHFASPLLLFVCPSNTILLYNSKFKLYIYKNNCFIY